MYVSEKHDWEMCQANISNIFSVKANNTNGLFLFCLFFNLTVIDEAWIQFIMMAAFVTWVGDGCQLWVCFQVSNSLIF